MYMSFAANTGRLSIVFTFVFVIQTVADQGVPNWSQWRGPNFTGEAAPASKPPIEWSEDKNIKWKQEIPGHGHSTPIIWGDRIYLQAAIPMPGDEKSDEDEKDDAEDRADASDRDGDRDQPRASGRRPGREERDGERREGRRGRRGRGRGRGAEKPTTTYQFVVMALDRKTGKPVWQKTVREQIPHEGSHPDGSLAPASPATDGQHLYAHFGSRGLYCLNMENGDVLWEKDLGDMQTRNGFGEGSSPALHGDSVVINWDHEGDSFIVALDKKSGKELWRRDRDESTTWTTPLIIEDGGKVLAVVPAANRIRAYDLKDGNVVWECGGLGQNCAPTPVANEKILLTMTGWRDPSLVAIRYRGAEGDITDSERVAWKLDGKTPYVPSPLLINDIVYFLQRNNGILSCHDAESGKPLYDQQRLEKITGIYASPVAANGHVYIVGRNGVTYVLKHGPEFKVVTTNELNDEFNASPAIVGNDIFLRGTKFLWCIGAK
jgi:outer membrane protein assembly factor BamB